eukprot:Sdes_comp15467_c0_seq1m4370
MSSWNPNRIIKPISNLFLKDSYGEKKDSHRKNSSEIHALIKKSLENLTAADISFFGSVEEFHESGHDSFFENLSSSEGSRMLLMRFLELPSPRWNSKMDNFFLQKGVIEMFAEFISLPAKQKTTKKGFFPQMSREYQDTEDLKRSYKVATLLSVSHGLTSRIAENAYQRFLSSLFRIFSADSQGNFHHCLKVVKVFSGFFATKLVETICQLSPTDFFIPFLNNLHEHTVLEMLADFIKYDSQDSTF